MWRSMRAVSWLCRCRSCFTTAGGHLPGCSPCCRASFSSTARVEYSASKIGSTGCTWDASPVADGGDYDEQVKRWSVDGRGMVRGVVRDAEIGTGRTEVVRARDCCEEGVALQPVRLL